MRTPTKILLVLNDHIQMIKARIATCEFILLRVIEFKYIRHGAILRSIILYLKIIIANCTPARTSVLLSLI